MAESGSEVLKQTKVTSQQAGSDQTSIGQGQQGNKDDVLLEDLGYKQVNSLSYVIIRLNQITRNRNFVESSPG
jgi:hypothetical protein